MRGERCVSWSRGVPRGEQSLTDMKKHTKTTIKSLNSDIYYIINDYLYKKDYQSFVMTCKVIYNEQIDKRYLSLNVIYSRKYHRMESFEKELVKLFSMSINKCLLICRTVVLSLTPLHSVVFIN